MNSYKHLEVYFHDRKVGTLAKAGRCQVAFEYSAEWLDQGFSISPFSLPLEKKVFLPKVDPFDGLFGVFADSLPDGWGRLLVDRFLIKKGMNPNTVDPINRLAIVNQAGMGALTYVPNYEMEEVFSDKELDEIATECRKLFDTDMCDDLDTLFALGGSSGGARPKIYTVVDEDPWIIKFPSSMDSKNIGKEEYDYSLCARECGIEMAETRLFPSSQCEGYFGTRRFDRVGEKRIHMISASALLETSHRIPNLDYNILMQLVLKLTGDYEEVEKMYRLMCFNVFAHNRDDHSKNFSFLYDEQEKRYKLSPAYDLTYSNSLGGEHATCINGNGSNPSKKDILAVADKMNMNHQKAVRIVNEIEEITKEYLHSYLKLG